jgi:hypothetical protein
MTAGPSVEPQDKAKGSKVDPRSLIVPIGEAKGLAKSRGDTMPEVAKIPGPVLKPGNSFKALRALANSIAREPARDPATAEPLWLDDHYLSVAEKILRDWANSRDPRVQARFLDTAFGAPPPTEIEDDEGKGNVRVEVVFKGGKGEGTVERTMMLGVRERVEDEEEVFEDGPPVYFEQPAEAPYRDVWGSNGLNYLQVAAPLEEVPE